MSAMTAEDRQASRDADRELLEAVLEGDNTAYRGLVEKYQTRVYSMVYGMVRNREDARDITQEAFVKAYHSLKGFRLESSFYTWLYRIAMNLSIDLTRKRKRREVSGFDENIASKDADGVIDVAHHGDSPSKALERKQLLGRIMASMQKLSDDQRQVILLREVEGLSYKEISDVMEIPEGTVMSRLFYARKKLQSLLTEDAS
jgi:RNA polymerase sigma-70 factor, ECF subfamily